MNNIGFGIFCFGEEYYFKGAYDKINHILNEGYHCYVLTDSPENFSKKYTDTFVHVIPYLRTFKSYSDKMLLPKYILKNHDICVLIDADTHIKDFSFLKTLKSYTFKYGISYINTLKNHASHREFIKDLITIDNPEWNSYHTYASKLYSPYGEYETIWEYFLIINKIGFNEKRFYNYYEKLQIAKEYSDLNINKEINGAGEGISIRISARLSETQIERDVVLYEILKDKMISVSKRYTPKDLWPDWMK